MPSVSEPAGKSVSPSAVTAPLTPRKSSSSKPPPTSQPTRPWPRSRSGRWRSCLASLAHQAVIVTGIYLALAGRAIAAERPGERTRRLARALITIVALQLVAGFVNVILLAPVWMQIVHLLLADVMWIAAILLGATALTQEAPVEQPALAAAAD